MNVLTPLKKHWKKVYAGVVLLSGVLLSPTHFYISQAETPYKNVSVPMIISSAYYEGNKAVSLIGLGDNSGEGGGVTETPTDEEGGAEGDSVSAANFFGTVKWVVDKGNFGNVGLLIGPRSNVKESAASIAQDNVGLDMNGIESLNNRIGGKPASYYYQFGLAMNKLLDEARKSDPAYLSIESVTDAMTSSISAAGRFGINLLYNYNPAPVVMAFYNSEYLNGISIGGYSGAETNKLIDFINSNNELRSFVRFFGDPNPVFGNLSNAQAITAVLVVLSFGIYAFMRLFNNAHFGTNMRKLVLRVIVASLGVPITAYMLAYSISKLTDAYTNSTESASEYILNNNLNISDWYNNTNFGLPSGVTLSVYNGEFDLTPEVVRAINDYSSVDITSGSRIGRFSNLAKGLSASADRLVETARSNDNMFKVGFKHPQKLTYTESDLVSDISNNGLAGIWTGMKDYLSGTSENWSIVPLVKVAEAMGEAKEWKPDEAFKEPVDFNFLTSGTLSASGSKGSYHFTGGGGYGFSPIAAYNLLNTTFNESGMRVKDNIEGTMIPSVAINVTNGTVDGEPQRANTLVRIVTVWTVLVASITAVVSIAVSGFGGLLAGSVSSAFGGIDGFGRAVGSVVALIVGIMGVSAFAGSALTLLDFLWDALTTAFGNSSDDFATVLQPIRDSVKEWRFLGIGEVIANSIDSMSGALLTIISFFFLPTALKMPITAITSWAASLPDTFAEKFRYWGSQFVGAQVGSPGGGGRSGGMGAARQQMAADNQRNTGRMMAAGAGAIGLAGAALGSAGAFMTGKYGNGDDQKIPESVNNADETIVEDNSEVNQSPTAEQNVQANNPTIIAEEKGIESNVDESIDAKDDTRVDEAYHDSVAGDEQTVNEADRDLEQTSQFDQDHREQVSQFDNDNLNEQDTPTDTVQSYDNYNPYGHEEMAPSVDKSGSISETIQEEGTVVDNSVMSEAGTGTDTFREGESSYAQENMSHSDMQTMNTNQRDSQMNQTNQHLSHSSNQQQSNLERQSTDKHSAHHTSGDGRSANSQGSQSSGSVTQTGGSREGSVDNSRSSINATHHIGNTHQQLNQANKQSMNANVSKQATNKQDMKQVDASKSDLSSGNMNVQETAINHGISDLSSENMNVQETAINQGIRGMETTVSDSATSMNTSTSPTASQEGASQEGASQGSTSQDGVSQTHTQGEGFKSRSRLGQSLESGGRAVTSMAQNVSHSPAGQSVVSGVQSGINTGKQAVSYVANSAPVQTVANAGRAVARETANIGSDAKALVGKVNNSLKAASQKSGDTKVLSGVGKGLMVMSGGRTLKSDGLRSLQQIASGALGFQMGAHRPSYQQQRHMRPPQQYVHKTVDPKPIVKKPGGANAARKPMRRDGGPYNGKSKLSEKIINKG